MKILPNLSTEIVLWKKGFKFIAGIDEVGRGAWAGPLVVGAVILHKNFTIPENFADSKKVKPLQRLKFSKFIKEKAVSWSIVEIAPSIINKVGMGKASQIAFRKVVRSLKIVPDFLLIDAFYIKHLNRKNQKAIIKGDEISASIAAASIIAKVYRDSLMKKLAKIYPNYRFAKHKGYGTKLHQEAIKIYGFSKIHRTFYKLDYLFA